MSAKPGYKDFRHPEAPGIWFSAFPALQGVLSDSTELECAPGLMLEGRNWSLGKVGGGGWRGPP